MIILAIWIVFLIVMLTESSDPRLSSIFRRRELVGFCEECGEPIEKGQYFWVHGLDSGVIHCSELCIPTVIRDLIDEVQAANETCG